MPAGGSGGSAVFALAGTSLCQGQKEAENTKTSPKSQLGGGGGVGGWDLAASARVIDKLHAKAPPGPSPGSWPDALGAG